MPLYCLYQERFEVVKLSAFGGVVFGIVCNDLSHFAASFSISSAKFKDRSLHSRLSITTTLAPSILQMWVI